jgi:hypothetical protein
LTLLAHKLARAVSSMLTRDTGFELDRCLTGDGSRVGEPAASLDTHGLRLPSRPWQSSPALRHRTRTRTEAFFSEPSRLLGHPLWLLAIRGWSDKVDVCCPAPEPVPHWRTRPVQPLFCRGRYEGTAQFLGRRGLRCGFSAITMPMVTEPPYVCGADTFGLLLRGQ